MQNYKIHIYETEGRDIGEIKYVMYFDTLDEMKQAYKKLYKKSLDKKLLNPTAWEYKEVFANGFSFGVNWEKIPDRITFEWTL